MKSTNKTAGEKSPAYQKFGNTSFLSGMCENMTFDDFKKKYAGTLNGHDIKDAFKKLGGKMTSPKKQTEKKESKK